MITIMIKLDMSINMKKMLDVVSFPKCVTVLRFEVGHFFSFSSGGTSELTLGFSEPVFEFKSSQNS